LRAKAKQEEDIRHDEAVDNPKIYVDEAQEERYEEADGEVGRNETICSA